MPPKPAAGKPGAKPVNKAANKPTSKVNEKAADKKEDEVQLEMEINLKQLANVVLQDNDGDIKKSGRWPLIIDESGASATFMKYRDVNVLDATNAVDFNPEAIRLAVLGSLRYGKGLCLDMKEEDSYKRCCEKFDEVLPGLMSLIISKDIMKEEHFKNLIKPTDPEEYQLNKMTSYEARVDNFQMFFVTENPHIDSNLSKKCYKILVQK